MDAGKLSRLRAEMAAAARRLLSTCKATPVTIIHHNDADGLCCAAALSLALERLGRPYVLLPLEKIHESTVQAIHAGRPRLALVYADLGGQNAGLLERQAGAGGNAMVLILDHHLPEKTTGGSVVQLNPELHGIDGDRQMSGAAVCALFAAALLEEGGRPLPGEVPALCGVIGAYGDGQAAGGALQGVNAELEKQALRGGTLRFIEGVLRVPGLGNRSMSEVVEVLNALGSIGFYSGTTELGVRFILGRDIEEALNKAAELEELKRRLFQAELDRLRRLGGKSATGATDARGSCAPWHLTWVDAADRFSPMGVKAIGLFLEELARALPAAEQVYLLGFQHLPAEQPGLGAIGGAFTKVSARVSAGLRARIEEGKAPDLMALVPGSARAVGGTADGCHRYTAAALIDRGREQAFVEAFRAALPA